MRTSDTALPPNATAILLLADGKMFFGEGIGAKGITSGEICFNTAMTGYQEVLTDPSYSGQIITFTFPHIGNVGCNDEDIEAKKPLACGLILREVPTPPSSFRAQVSLDQWLRKWKMTGIAGVDTRAITRHIRKKGAQNCAIVHAEKLTKSLINEAKKKLKSTPDMDGLELAEAASTRKPYDWKETRWKLGKGYGEVKKAKYHVVALDFGEKLNILRSLSERGCEVSVVPAKTSAEAVLKMKPDGVFLSNGPGDPAATGEYAIGTIKKLIDSNLPVFGICLGHQMMGIAMGGKTEKMPQGHRGANHPVKDLKTGKVIITSQNHGFAVNAKSLPTDVEVTHISLFDGTVQGLRHKKKPAFCVQGHPEASPGPHDSQYLFDQFIALMEKRS